jgi:hypothetical protein
MVDFLFYYLHTKYKKWGEKDIPEVYALAIISVLQLLNFFSFIFLLLHIGLIKIEALTNYVVIGITIGILLVNYMYIFKIKGRKAILTQFESKNGRHKRIKRTSIIYVIVTVIVFVSLLAVYIKS